jgi:hypothetical protein
LPIATARDAVLFDLIARLVCTGCGGKLDVRVHVPRLAKFGGRARRVSCSVS